MKEERIRENYLASQIVCYLQYLYKRNENTIRKLRKKAEKLYNKIDHDNMTSDDFELLKKGHNCGIKAQELLSENNFLDAIIKLLEAEYEIEENKND